MTITYSTKADIPEIFNLYQKATDLQKQKFPENQWPQFAYDLVASEVAEQRQFKLMIDNQIACIWAITYSDPHIWEEAGKDSSIYIHRIATNPAFRGKNLVENIVVWAKEFARFQDKQFIRMDTCGRNERLIDHYTKYGFEFLGTRKLQNTSELPSHYHGAEVCFFEIRI